MYVVFDTRESSAPTGLIDEVDDRILVYPNPTGGSFLVQLPENLATDEVDRMEILDLSGRPIKSFSFNKGGNYEISAPPGTYLVRFPMKSGDIETQRIVIN
jgi:hypothetical protein